MKRNQSHPSYIRTRIGLGCALALLLFAPIARAEDIYVQASFGGPNRETITINAMVGQSRIIQFNRPIGRLSVSSSEVAEAVVVSANEVVVNGKAFGQVNIVVWDRGGERSLVFEVFVRANLTLLDSLVRSLFPRDDILLSQANGSVILSGEVDDPRKVAQVEAAVQAAGFKTVNMLRGPFRNATQVQLQVRVAEVNRNRLREFGTSYSYQATPGSGGYLNSGSGPSTLTKIENGSLFGSVSSALNLFLMGGNAMGFLRMLQSQGALRALAEPNVIAMDGQTASFLAGGEFPIPIVQSGSERSTISIIFKEYGVRLGFKPTVVAEDYIRLELEPEVSTIDYANGVKFDGFTVPALRTRRAKTGIELRDGQSFALAGLLDNSEIKSLSKMPVLGDMPVLGPLFRSQQFQKQETELMFIVTATIVRPVNPDALPQMRGLDDLKSGSPLAKTETGESLAGRTGFALAQAARQPLPAAPATAPPIVFPFGFPLAQQAAEVQRSIRSAAQFALMLPANLAPAPASRPRLAGSGDKEIR